MAWWSLQPPVDPFSLPPEALALFLAVSVADLFLTALIVRAVRAIIQRRRERRGRR